MAGVKQMLGPNRIKAVIFDMDGLMLDTEPIYRLSWQRAVADLGATFRDEDYPAFVGRSTASCDRLMLDLFGADFPLTRCHKLRKIHWKAYVQENGIPMKPGLLELFEFLEEQQIPKAIATASVRADANVSLPAAGIEQYFTISTAGDEVPNNKPAPDIYLASAAKLRVKPEQCLVLEDSNTGAMAAISAGATTLMIPDMQMPTADIKARVHSVVSSLHDVRLLLEQSWLQPAVSGEE